ncbi:Sensors of blue-light using FAD [Solimonas aquatica]|uniref:Sensors of blue-light using FAD n=1 Tax=Solimonas aquatica TaxID=489703 RepID=A0A1H9FKU8_9GAMM|nr:BLUF domain-containing protein [Solimonas aquatica]SEQ38542.1 Sensors of blue-light using FAD [Solimonas aquatica]
MELVHCIYTSAARSPAFGRKELDELLKVCRTNNQAHGVTGMLLFEKGSFFQILEGERSQVEALFDKIATDPRHVRINKLIVERIAQRDFGEWTMGHGEISALDLLRIPGLNDFFSRGQSYEQLNEGRAKLLLAAFRDGDWRTRLS